MMKRDDDDGGSLRSLSLTLSLTLGAWRGAVGPCFGMHGTLRVYSAYSAVYGLDVW